MLLTVCLFSTRSVVARTSQTTRIPPGQWHTFTTENGLAGNTVQSIWEDKRGHIWLGTENGISRYDGHTWATYRMADGLLDNNVWAISGDTDSVWCATSSGISVLHNDQWHHYTSDDGLPINDIRAILVTPNGTIWAGTFGQGIVRKQSDSTRWERVVLTENGESNGLFVQSIWQAHHGAIWIGTSGSGAFRLDERGVEQFTFRHGRHNTVWAAGAAFDSYDTWLATLRGIVHIRANESIDIIEETINNYRIIEAEVLTVAGGPANELWFGTRTRGVFHHTKDSTWMHYAAEDGPGSNYIISILVDRAGRVWFGTRGNGVTMVDRHPLDKTSLRPIVTALDVSNDTPLSLSDTPLLNHNQNNIQFHFHKDMAWLPPQDIHFHYWLEQLDTPDTFRREQVSGHANTAKPAVSAMFLDLDSGDYVLHTYASVADVDGPEMTYPFKIQSAPPTLAAETLEIHSDGTRIQQQLTLPPDLFGTPRDVSFRIHAKDDVTARYDMRYRYRLTSQADTWHEVSGDSITLSLEQGQHRLEIQAIDSDGNSSEPLSVSVMVPSPLLNTILFYMILISIPSSISAAIGALGYKRWTHRQALQRAVKGYVIPYDVGPLITTTDRYIGRQHIIDTIIGKIANNSFYIYGEQRIGKTSLLLQLKQRFAQRNIMQPTTRTITVFRNIQDLPQEQFWLYLVRSISAEIGTIPLHIAALGAPDNGYDDLDAESDLERMIEYVQKHADVQDISIILLLDEIDTLCSYDPPFRQRFRAFCQHMQRWVRVVLAGIMPPHGDTGETSPWYNIFEPMGLGPLDKKDILYLIRYYNNNPYTYTSEAEQALLSAGACRPFDTQWLCSESVRSMLAANRTYITITDVKQAIAVVVRERESYYTMCWQQLSEEARQHMHDAHTSGGFLSIKTFLRYDIERLFDLGMIRQTGRGYRLTVLAHYWLEEYA